MRRLETENAEQIEARIMKRLRFMLEYSWQHYRFCRERLASAGLRPNDVRTLRDFRKIPIIRKQELAHYLERDHLHSVSRGVLTSTGGSTGTPLFFLTGREAGIAGIASKVFFEGWLGVEPHDRKFALRSRRRLKDRLFLNETQFSSVAVLNDLAEACRKILRIKPKLIEGNSTFRILASWMVNQGISAGDWLRGIVAFGIPLLPDQIAIISKAFTSNIYDRYGAAEHSGPLAHQCEEREGLHVNTELCLVEVLRDNEPCAEGERGRIVITNLRNLATPFIRYDQEDTAVPLDDCACNRQMPLISELWGRDPSLYELRGGLKVSVAALLAIVGHLHEARHIERFSFARKSADQLILSIHPKNTFYAETAASIERQLNEKLGKLVEVLVDVEGHPEWSQRP